LEQGTISWCIEAPYLNFARLPAYLFFILTQNKIWNLFLTTYSKFYKLRYP